MPKLISFHIFDVSKSNDLKEKYKLSNPEMAWVTGYNLIAFDEEKFVYHYSFVTLNEVLEFIKTH